MESKDRQQLLRGFMMFGISFAALMVVALVIFGGFTSMVSHLL